MINLSSYPEYYYGKGRTVEEAPEWCWEVARFLVDSTREEGAETGSGTRKPTHNVV